MLGDVDDFVSRLWRVLPTRWFGDNAPFGTAVLSGFGTAWSGVYALIEAVRAQARLLTASGVFVDMISADFFGGWLPRRSGESDSAFVVRIGFELLRPRGRRQALVTAVTELTGRPPIVFEPALPADTGGYNVGGVGYGVAGGWGDLSLAYQSLLQVHRPQGAGIAELAGYDTGGVLAYGSLTMVETQVSDADIFAQVAAVLPAGYTAWVSIQN